IVVVAPYGTPEVPSMVEDALPAEDVAAISTDVVATRSPPVCVSHSSSNRVGGEISLIRTRYRARTHVGSHPANRRCLPRLHGFGACGERDARSHDLYGTFCRRAVCAVDTRDTVSDALYAIGHILQFLVHAARVRSTCIETDAPALRGVGAFKRDGDGGTFFCRFWLTRYLGGRHRAASSVANALPDGAGWARRKCRGAHSG